MSYTPFIARGTRRNFQRLDRRFLSGLQSMKTGALIRHACEAGAIVGGATHEERQRLVRYGETVGLAFQLADDLLDVTQSTDAMGKATGKDAAAGKGTLVALRGTDWARGELDRLVAEAEDALAPFGDAAGILADTARFIANRQS